LPSRRLTVTTSTGPQLGKTNRHNAMIISPSSENVETLQVAFECFQLQ
jgi:hypothetical protein